MLDDLDFQALQYANHLNNLSGAKLSFLRTYCMSSPESDWLLATWGSWSSDGLTTSETLPGCDYQTHCIYSHCPCSIGIPNPLHLFPLCLFHRNTKPIALFPIVLVPRESQSYCTYSMWSANSFRSLTLAILHVNLSKVFCAFPYPTSFSDTEQQGYRLTMHWNNTYR